MAEPNQNEIPSPGDFIRDELRARGWTQTDLSRILDRPLPTVNEIIVGKRAVMPEMAVALGMAFGTAPEVWMNREAAYRLSLTEKGSDDVRKRARLYEIAPVKEMEKRQWIAGAETAAELETELKQFFGVDTLDEGPVINASLRTSIAGPINPAQRAWCFRARTMAKSVPVSSYSDSKLDRGIDKLKKLAAWPDSAARVSRVLADMGIRFVVIEPLTRTRIDGAALWLNEKSPVIAVSMRYDRIDNFWHTIGHEMSHIRHRDGESLDIDLVGTDRPAPVEHDAVERRADQESSATWLDQSELESFIVRVGPLYSKARINQFANRIKVHPGIIVGQLQYRGELGYQACHDCLPKIRHFVTTESLTDGWGHSVKL